MDEHTPHPTPHGPGRNAQGTVSRCYLCGQQFTHTPVIGERNGARFRFCSEACEATSTADAGDALPVAPAPHTPHPTPDTPHDRKAQVAAEMRSYHMNQVAVKGLCRVPGGMRVKGRPAELADQADIGESIDQRRGSLLAKVISLGMRAAVAVRTDRMTVEAYAREVGTSPIAVLHAICMYDADCRGLLAQKQQSSKAANEEGAGVPSCLRAFVPTPPFSILQAEIAAGIRGIDGEFRGVFSGVPDTLDPEGRSANRGEI